MGITTEEFFQNIYNVLFSPKEFFEDENSNISIRLAVGLVIVMTVINKSADAIIDNTMSNWAYILSLIFGIIGSILFWFLFGLFFEYIAKIFDRGGNLAKLLYLSAFAMVPAIFFAPLNLIKQAGELGYIISVILGGIFYIWIFILYALAVKNAYKITLARSFMLIFLPIISSILAIYQFVGFYHKMLYIFSI